MSKGIQFWCTVVAAPLAAVALLWACKPGMPPAVPSDPKQKLLTAVAMAATNAEPNASRRAVVGSPLAFTAPTPTNAPIAWLEWDEVPGQVSGYAISGTDTRSGAITEVIEVGKTNRIPDPGWMYVQVAAFDKNRGAVGFPAVGLRCRVARSGQTALVTFVPMWGRTNVVEVAYQLGPTAQWARVATVWGETPVTVAHTSARTNRFYRARAL